MQLPSGITVTDGYLRGLADSIVSEYASYGFEEWHEAIHSHGHLIGEHEWNGEGPIEDEKDQDAIIEAVEPVAKEFATKLGGEYRKLYAECLENRTW